MPRLSLVHDRQPPCPDYRVLMPFLATVAIIKLLLLAAWGPAIFPDTGAYVDLARSILDDPDWWKVGGWGTSYAPPRLLRPYGYPLLIAAAMRLSADHYGEMLVVLQSLFSLVPLALAAWVARPLISDPRLRALVLVLYAASGFMLFDLAILTDSFYSSLFLSVFLLIAAQILGLVRPSLPLALGLGLAWGLSITLRDVGLLHSFLPLSGLLLVGYWRRLGWGRSLTIGAAFVLPIAAIAFATIQWNQLRTGHAFYSITGGINWLWPSVNIADRGLADPFDCADAICQTAKAHGFTKGMEGVFSIAAALWDERHLDPVDFSRLTLAHFIGVAKTHPAALIASMIGNLQFPHLADLIFNPLANTNELAFLHSNVAHRLFDAPREMLRSVKGGAWWLALPLLVQWVANALSIAALAFTIIGTPWIIGKRLRQGANETIATLYLWLMAAGFIASYCIVHMEMRHALPAVPLILLAFGWSVARIKPERRF